MGIYCWETHVHTGEISPCGQVSAADVAQNYIDNGYAGLVVTNHLSDYGFSYVRDRSWEEKVNWFYEGYEMVRGAAGDRLTVLFGAEINFRGDPNDYLVYGITKEFLLAHPELLDLRIGDFSRLARENGFMLIQAHPFRNGMRVVPPDQLDGIEAYNGNLRHDSRNFLAAQWAARYGLIATSGSDFHELEDTARGGFFTGREIRTIDDFMAALKDRPVLKTSAERFGL